ncbi:MAG: uroporphyrinogen-III C-methyltransferase [Deltaproteobacteria bacterium]|nr:uroporphyrinogen-III C-methyltransferase [Deltaproteobacteria bacterium]
MPTLRSGHVYLVGAGPGDPGLVTVKGAEALKKADTVIYDFLANARLLTHAKKAKEFLYVGKKGASKNISQEKINSLIVSRAKSGQTVVRLKGGDPFIFGRGAEEALSLVKNNIPFSIIPGVTSAIAAPAYAGIPLTHRGYSSSVTFLTGHEGEGKTESSIRWDLLAKNDSTLVILMGWKNMAAIARRLIENGRPASTPAAAIRWGTLATQKTVTATLGTIAGIAKKQGLMPPLIIVVGDIVGLGKKLNWFEELPLFGRRVLVTRAAEQASDFSNTLEGYGAIPVPFPAIKTVAPKNTRPLDTAIRRLSSYNWAIFTSVNGVKYFFERLYALGLDLRELKGVKICSIGPATAEAIKERGIKIDLVPKEFKAEGVLKALGKKSISGKRFVLPRAEVAREVLPDEIRRLGGTIDVVTVYTTVKPKKETAELKKTLLKAPVDVVTFTSSSTVTNFCSLFKTKAELKRALGKAKIACIGPITAKTAKDNGLKTDIMPKDYTTAGLASAMAAYFKKAKKAE